MFGYSRLKEFHVKGRCRSRRTVIEVCAHTHTISKSVTISVCDTVKATTTAHLSSSHIRDEGRSRTISILFNFHYTFSIVPFFFDNVGFFSLHYQYEHKHKNYSKFSWSGSLRYLMWEYDWPENWQLALILWSECHNKNCIVSEHKLDNFYVIWIQNKNIKTQKNNKNIYCHCVGSRIHGRFPQCYFWLSFGCRLSHRLTF